MIRYSKGTVSIEVAIGLPFFIGVLAIWFEICLLMIANSVADHALVTAVSFSKKQGDTHSRTPVDYEQIMLTTLEATAGRLWSGVIKPESVKSNLVFFKNFENVTYCSRYSKIIENCSMAEYKPDGMGVALYSLEYEYSPLFKLGMPDIPIRREYFAVQEYERCSFKKGMNAGHYCEKR